jgi:hypothetical protein
MSSSLPHRQSIQISHPGLINFWFRTGYGSIKTAARSLAAVLMALKPEGKIFLDESMPALTLEES